MQEFDQRDRELLNVLQNEVPLISTPFAVIGQRIDMSEKEVIKRADRLTREGTIKQISGVFDSRAMGYKSCLVAAKVDPDDIERAAAVVSSHPGVSQNYRRNHEFNLWFTIAVPPSSKFGLERTIDILGEQARWKVARMMPTLRHFKHPESDSDPSNDPGSESTLREDEIEVVRLLQKDLPLQPRPFEVLTRGTTLDAEKVLELARVFLKNQQMRKFAAAVVPRKGAFTASVMGVWSVPEKKVDSVGAELAQHRSVSQCYLRPTFEDWPYNVFTTVHGRSVDECEAVLRELSESVAITEMRALFPTKEFKRSRVSFFSPENDLWESSISSSSQASAAS